MLHIKNSNVGCLYKLVDKLVDQDSVCRIPPIVYVKQERKHSEKDCMKEFIDDLVEYFMNVAFDFDHPKYKISWDEENMRKDLKHWIQRQSL